MLLIESQKILERSVAALEYSNTLLLQTSLSTDSTKLDRTPSPQNTISDLPIGRGARSVSERLQDNHVTQERWMEDLETLSKDLDNLCGPSNRAGVDIKRRRTLENDNDHSISRSLPSTGPIYRKATRRSSVDAHVCRNDSGRLQLAENEQRLYSHPPRAMTQYVHADAVFGDGPEASPTHHHSILLPSTNGLRSSSHVSDFNSPSSSVWSPPHSQLTPSTPAYTSLARHARRLPRSPSSSRSP